MSGEGERHPRHQRNIQGLLRFALEATQAEDAPNPANFQEMDPERREFLENALKAMAVNVIEQLEKAARVLTDVEASEDDQIGALKIIRDYVCDIDSANDFCKIDGLGLLLPCLESPFNTVRSLTASIAAELAQNNPFCQKALLDAKALPALMQLLNNPPTAPDALHAMSCIVRGYEPASASFIEIGGLECLLGCIQQLDQERVIVRAVFLLRAICSEYPAVRDELVKLNAIEVVVASLRPQAVYDVRLENTLSALSLLTDNDDALRRCRRGDLKLRDLLIEIRRLCDNKPECLETIEFCDVLERKIYEPDLNEVTDR